MNFFKMSLAVAALGLMSSVALAAGTDSNLSAAQKTEVENVVRELLLNKEPDLIVKAAQEMQRRTEKEEMTKGQEAISKKEKELYSDPDSQVMGNKNGDVTIVEFFDYQCGYCKVVQPAVQELLESDKNLRFIFKEYPILGPGSMFASKAALASVKQNKYVKFHEALMTSKQHLTDDGVLEVAEDVGIDVKKLKVDMEDPKITKMLDKNRALGESLGARGTPTFIIGGKLYPGALPVDQMKEIISNIRKASK